MRGPGLLWALLLALFATQATGCIGGCSPDYSEGERTGIVLKLSKKGIFMKSWEGQLDLGGVSIEDGHVVRNIWDFSVTDDAVAAKIQDGQRAGRRLSLHYSQWWVSPVGLDTDYVVKEVR